MDRETGFSSAVRVCWLMDGLVDGLIDWDLLLQEGEVVRCAGFLSKQVGR